MFMKKTFLLLSVIALSLSFTLTSCGGEDEDGPSIYTVTFKNIGGETVATEKAPAKGTLGDKYPSDETLGVPADVGFVSDTQYKVFTGWRDQDGNVVRPWTPIQKDLTVKPTFYEIPAEDTVTVGTSATPNVTFKLETDDVENRIRGHKYFRLVQEGGLQSGHVYKIEADYTITSPTGFHFVSFSASLDQYGWHADWLNDLTTAGSVSISIPNSVPADSKNQTAYKDDALHFFVDFGQADTTAAAFAGQSITVAFTKLLVTDEGAPPVVTFNVNGGDGANVVIETTNGKKFGASELPSPTKTDKVFKGWSSDATGTAQVDPTTIAVMGDTTYYAIWADQEWVISLGTGSQIEGIPVSTFNDDDYIEVVFGGTSPGPNYGVGALADGKWAGQININTPPTALPEGEITWKVRFLVKTVKAAVGDTLVINTWGDFVATGANRITFVEPPEVPVIPEDAVVLWKAGDGTEKWVLPEYQFTVTAGSDGELNFAVGEGTYASISLVLDTAIDVSNKTVYVVVKGAGTAEGNAMKYFLGSDETHGSENNTLLPTSADAWQVLTASNFWKGYKGVEMEDVADLTAVNEFSILFENADYSWSLYAVYIK
jgi:uncharacterized repeat protein (TIGR02543 family)